MSFFDLLRVHAISIPYVLILLIGITLSAVRWQRHPAVSTMAIAAFLIFLLRVLLHIGLNYYLSLATHDPAQTHGIFFTFNIIGSALSTIAVALLLCAVFGWRSESPKTVVKKS